jgi:hypothetical protein
MIHPKRLDKKLPLVMLMLTLAVGVAGAAPGLAGTTVATDVISSAGGTSTSVSGTIKMSDTFGQGPIGPVATGSTIELHDGFWATISAAGAAADTTPPEHVTNFTATATDDGVILRWTNPSDADFAGTMIRYSVNEYPGDPTEHDPVPNGAGGLFYGAPASADSFVHTGLDADSPYYYSAFAFDEVPNYTTERCASATPVDTIPPTAAASFTATAGDTAVVLRWTNSSDTDFDHALIRFSTVSHPKNIAEGSPVPNGRSGVFANVPASVDSFVHTHLTNGVTYHYSIWSGDEVPNYSGYWDASAAPEDTIPPGTPDYFTAAAGDRKVTLLWKNPPDADLEEIAIRYSTSGYPTLPTAGSAVENGSGGIFPAVPAAVDSFVHDDLVAGVTYYYSAFEYDEAGNYLTYTSDLATPFDNTPPEVAVSVFQNPYLTGRLDIYLIASEPVSDSSVVVTVGETEVEMTANDADEYVWRGDYDLCCTGDLSIKGCARDIALNRTCATRDYSASLLLASSGGVARSADGQLELGVHGGVLGGDSYVLVGEVVDRPGAVVKAYEVSPAGLEITGFVEVAIAWPESASAPEHFSVAMLAGAEATPLDSYLDRGRGRVLAYADRLGSYGLIWRPDAVTPAYGETGLTVLQNTPNPFLGSTSVRFEIGSAGHVGIEIVGVDGRVVRTLFDEFTAPGSHTLDWDGRDDHGRVVAGGVYVCKARFGSETVTHKMVHMR